MKNVNFVRTYNGYIKNVSINFFKNRKQIDGF